MESLPANMFPTAPADAPDLQDDNSAAPVSTGFPAAPAPAAFKHTEAEMLPQRTKGEIAIAYLTANGPTTREELAAHLGIDRSALSAYLVTAVRDGCIELGKTMAMLGTGKLTPKGRPTTKDDKAPAPRPVEVKPEPIKAAAAPSQASLSCGHLYARVSITGAMEIGVGHTTVQLSEAQAALLRMFLAEACAE